MKLLVMLLVALFAVWLWRSRHPDPDRQPKPARPRSPRRGNQELASPEPMVRCAVCGVHLPRQDALASRGSHYCGALHLEQAEGQRRAASSPP